MAETDKGQWTRYLYWLAKKDFTDARAHLAQSGYTLSATHITT